MNRYS